MTKAADEEGRSVAAPPPAPSLIEKLDPRGLFLSWFKDGSPTQRAIGAFGLLVIAPATIYGILNNWGGLLTLARSARQLVEGLSVLPEWLRILIFLAGCVLCIILIIYAQRISRQGLKLATTSAASVPLLVVALVAATWMGAAEVAPSNIGIVTAHPTREAVVAATRQVPGVDGDHGVRVAFYDVGRKGMSRTAIRRFINEENIRYLVVSAAMAEADIASLHDLISSRGLTIITTPEANGQSLVGNSVGIFVSPEAEADRIEAQLVDDRASRLLLIYERAPAELESFENRFRAQLAASLALNVVAFDTGQLRTNEPHLLAQIPAHDIIVLAASGPDSDDLLRRVRKLNPRARLISTSRILDHAAIATLAALRVETILPWRVLDDYQRALELRSENARLPIPVETASVMAVQLALILDHRVGGRRPDEARAAMMANREEWFRPLGRYYGQIRFAEGPMPHLQIGALTKAAFGADPHARTKR